MGDDLATARSLIVDLKAEDDIREWKFEAMKKENLAVAKELEDSREKIQQLVQNQSKCQALINSTQKLSPVHEEYSRKVKTAVVRIFKEHDQKEISGANRNELKSELGKTNMVDGGLRNIDADLGEESSMEAYLCRKSLSKKGAMCEVEPTTAFILKQNKKAKHKRLGVLKTSRVSVVSSTKKSRKFLSTPQPKKAAELAVKYFRNFASSLEVKFNNACFPNEKYCKKQFVQHIGFQGVTSGGR